ncbi:MAG: hypothetical protein J5I81_11865 [Nitrococcus mobilis]|nr:hypothetical protein [Nitrococcus mobilis]
MENIIFKLLRYAARIDRLFNQVNQDIRVHLSKRKNTTRPVTWRIFNQIFLLINSGVSAKEYYLQSLWSSNLSKQKRREYLGGFGSYEWQTAKNIKGYTALMDDKFLFDVILRTAGLNTGTTLAIYSETALYSSCLVLKDAAAFKRWFVSNGENIFIKPLRGINGKGTLSIGKRLPAAQSSWEQLPSKQSISLDEVSNRICNRNGEEFIIQKRLMPSAEMAQFSKNVLQTLRVMTLRGAHDIKLVAAALKIGSGKSAVDNLLHGKNMIAAVNLDNGKLSAAVEAIDGEPVWHSSHPISNAPIEGFQLQNINEIKSLVLRAAENFPWFKTVGWDVALTADGPIILEGNYWADILLIQIAHKKGVLSWPEYRAFFYNNQLYRRIGMGFMRPLPY